MFADHLFILLLALSQVNAVEVDNSVEGIPTVHCGDDSISLNVVTSRPFGGHIFVKGKFADPDCRTDANSTINSGQISLKFTSCGVERIRSADPRGVFVSVTLIVAFHPLLITKVDRAYMMQCFYMEASKIVTTELQVSMLTTSLQTGTVNMPVCTYEVLSEGPTGEPIFYAKIGQKVYHKWTCDSDHADQFCMIVHSCKVDDGAGDTIQLLNNEGTTVNSQTPVCNDQGLFFRHRRSVEAQKIFGVPVLNGHETFIHSEHPSIILPNDDPSKMGNYLLDDICMTSMSMIGYAMANSLLILGSFGTLAMACYRRFKGANKAVNS